MGLTLASSLPVLDDFGTTILDNGDKLCTFVFMELILHFCDPAVKFSGLFRLEMLDGSSITGTHL